MGHLSLAWDEPLAGTKVTSFTCVPVPLLAMLTGRTMMRDSRQQVLPQRRKALIGDASNSARVKCHETCPVGRSI